MPNVRRSQPCPPPSVSPATPGRRHDATDGSETEELRLAVDVSPRRSALRSNKPTLDLDTDASHRRQVDHDAAVAGRESGDVVPAAANRGQELVLRREADGARTSATPPQRTISAGLLSIIRLKTLRASS